MVSNGKLQVADQTKLVDLTVGELKVLIREIVANVVEQAVFEIEQQLPDPDEGKAFSARFTEQLEQALDESGELVEFDNVVKELGLDE